MSGQQIDHLVKMANQIALNFGEQRDLSRAAQCTAEHLEKFWTRAMREQLSAYADAGGEDLSPAVRLVFAGQSDTQGSQRP
ncbi:formate dehydrogenase subunit delta [Pseudohalioglobus sediminis]|uniref:Formate dehydrogenase subunit delta n=1 Tax=Pseudohalioglobus sediminis TaxID=2606449 RepID=A0A5B0X491_9GAMM|nr:formate dehydrogenase subunit delta [Pseudohalioglobus sediminis]KAA1194144.1 formate dehydrogenase subunit delta [Pseudohalioglobus sediminis]